MMLRQSAVPRLHALRGLLAASLTVLLTFSAPATASAVTLQPTVALSSGEVSNLWSPAIGASGSRIHVVYRYLDGSDRQIRYRRSTDGGVTWKAPVELSRPAATYSVQSSLSVAGLKVDVVWVEQVDAATGAEALFHRYSLDGGSTWTAPKRLTAATVQIVSLPVVRRIDSTVLVAYTDGETGGTYVRRSVDGGQAWLARVKIGTTTHEPFGPGAYGSEVRLAGTTTLFAVFKTSATRIVVRTSSDAGATWTAAKLIDSTASEFGAVDVAAAGSGAVITYGWFDGSTPEKAAIRRTSNAGESWTARAYLTDGSLGASGGSVLRAGAKWRVVYRQCVDASCLDPLALWYRESADGVAWSTPVRFSILTRDSYVGGLAYTSTNATTWVAWAGWLPLESDGGNIYVRGLK